MTPMRQGYHLSSMAAAKTTTIRERLARSRALSKQMRADGDRASRHLRSAAQSLRAQRQAKTAERLP
jgi:hypothetical protein